MGPKVQCRMLSNHHDMHGQWQCYKTDCIYSQSFWDAPVKQKISQTYSLKQLFKTKKHLSSQEVCPSLISLKTKGAMAATMQAPQIAKVRALEWKQQRQQQQKTRANYNLPSTRWAPSSYKWSYNPYKWPYKWLTVLITLVIGVINPVITGRGPTLYLQ